MTSLNLVLRPSIRTGRNPGSLSLRLIHNRRCKSITLRGCKIYPEEWNKKEQEIIYPENNPYRMAYLERIESRINQEVDTLNSLILTKQREGSYDLDDLMKLYRFRRDDGKLLSYVEALASEMERDGQMRTARAYRTVARGLVKFNKNIDLPLKQITHRLIKSFETYLKEKGKKPNTISYYMRNLRAIYNKAVKSKRIAKRRLDNPFEGVYAGVNRTLKRCLSLQEVQRLYDLDIVSLLEKERPGTREFSHLQKLHTAKRYFGFCFYARGMCFVDLVFLKKENIRGGILSYVRRKTGQQIDMKVSAEMKQIIESFADEVKASPYLFPIISTNEKNLQVRYETALRTQNDRLKELAALAGLNKPLSTHWTRHSWATLAKQLNVTLRVISECLGHNSEKTTLIYLDSLENSVLDEASELIASAVKTTRCNNNAFFNS
ncbi:site-specific integrase [Bacteroidales bacterium OttesenSCG-928-M11]|nr:site-specific integrase [Bacteroidales bacterium OttesenSCG-928-M11]